MGLFSDRRGWLPLLGLFLLGLALFLPRLGTSGLWDPWEPKYAQTAREMADGDHAIIPHYREDPRLNKPPMTYWLIALSHAVLGVNETAARLPSALLAVFGGLALALGFMVRGRALEGFLAGAALLTSPQWLLLGRFATPDMPLAAFLAFALALVIALPAVDEPRLKRILLLLIVIAVAAAALTDWPRALLLPAWAVLAWGAVRSGWKGLLGLAAVAICYHVGQLEHNVPLNLVSFGLAALLVPSFLKMRGALTLRASLVGLLLIVLLVAPWFLAAYGLEPEQMSIFEYKHAYNLGESSGGHTGPYDYILRIVIIGGLPWAAAASVGLIRGFGRKRDELACVLSGAWIGSTLFFTLSEAQMGHFYGVIQPPLAALAAVGLVAVIRRRDWTLGLVAAVLAVIWWLVRAEPSRILETATVKRSLYGLDLFTPATVTVAVWFVLLLVCWLTRRPTWAIACVLPAAIFAGALGFWMVPSLEPKKSLKPLWTRYLLEREGTEPIAMFLKAKESGFYYSDNAIVRVKRTSDLTRFLSGPGAKYVIMPRGALASIETSDRAAFDRWEELDRSHSTHTLARYLPPPGPPFESRP